MPIFDDPGKALRRMEEELLAEENSGEPEDGEDTPVNYAVDFHRMAYADEELDDADVCYLEDPRAARKRRKQEKKKKKTGCFGKLLRLLVLMGLVLAIVWWLKWNNGSL